MDRIQESSGQADDFEISLAQRLIDSLPTFELTGTSKQRYVTATVRHECDDINVFAQTRAEQLVQLIDMADHCEPQFEPVLRSMAYEIAREVAGLVRSLTQSEESRHD